MENESSATANVNFLEENENHMLTVVGSRSERVDEELFYFINADELTDISQAVNQQNIEVLTGDLCIINYQERFFKELNRTNVLHIKCIYSFVEKLLEYQHHSRRSNCSIEKQCDIIKIIGFANKYSLSNESGKELLEIINNIYTRYDAEGTISGTLNGIKNSVLNDMSHYNYQLFILSVAVVSVMLYVCHPWWEKFNSGPNFRVQSKSASTKYLFTGMYKESIYLQQAAMVKCSER